MLNKCFLIIAISLLSAAIVFSKDGNTNKKRLQKVTTNDYYAHILINNIYNMYSNNGDGSYNTFNGNSGFEFPKGSGATAIFEDGMLWGGYHNGSLKVGGSAYRKGLQAGKIITPGNNSYPPIAGSPSDPKYRMYRVRPDIHPTNNADTVAKQNSILLQQEVPLISRYDNTITVEKLRLQYYSDWNSWPAYDGAPFTDVDKNGIYDSTIDIPGEPGANQTLWHVSNDLDFSRTLSLYGSSPIGIEMQRTIWGYAKQGSSGNILFTRTILINKSGKNIDSMYITQWSDPDLGDAGDDFVGCDTTMDLGYVYNGKDTDAVYQKINRVPPAAGYVLLQGPLVTGVAGEDRNKNGKDDATDFGIFNGKKINGKINLPMSSFNFFINGSALYTDPTQGNIVGTTMWFNLMRGLITTTGGPNIDPITRKPTKMAFYGDPVTDEGWTDGKIFSNGNTVDIAPGDRRISMNTGPFTFAAGDTQEILVATLAAQGTSRLNSITELKRSVSVLKDIPPLISLTKNSVGQTVTISLTADAMENKGVSLTASLLNYNDMPLTSAELFDDGTHNDFLANDGIFGSTLSLPMQMQGVYLNINEHYSDGHTVLWKHVRDNISIAPLQILSPVVASDNINNDGIVNAGEIVRFNFSVHNESPFLFSHLNATVRHSFDYKPIILPDVGANSNLVLSYNQNEPSTYLTFVVPNNYSDSVYEAKVYVSDSVHNIWKNVLKFSVKPLQYPVTSGGSLLHNSGLANNDFKIIIVDPTKVKNHTYTIQGVDSINSKFDVGYSLKDSTANSILVKNNPIDWTGNVTSVTDGFKILAIDSMGFRSKLDNWTNPHGVNRIVFSPVTINPINDFSSFRNILGNEFDAWNPSYLSPYRKLKNTLIKLANVDIDGNIIDATNVSSGYRYLRNATLREAIPAFKPFIKNKTAGYAYQDYVPVPFTVWDIDDALHPRQLMVGFLENNTRWGKVDGKYWPPHYVDVNHGNNITAASPCEWIFIFDKDYSATPDPTLQVDILGTVTPLMWVGIGMQQTSSVWTSVDDILLLAHHTITSKDIWSFKPTVTVVKDEKSIPGEFALSQNYPNPFNPTTMISYQVPSTNKVRLKIFDLLGREVAVLVNEEQKAGWKEVQWNAAGFASGVYFYRLQAGNYISTKKMMVLK